MVIDIKEYKQKTAERNLLQALTQSISTAALIDITQEINCVVHFMGSIKDECGIDSFSALDPESRTEDPERRADLLFLAHLCEFHSKNLQKIADMALEATGAPTIEEELEILNKAKELGQNYPGQHETILQKYGSILTNIE